MEMLPENEKLIRNTEKVLHIGKSDHDELTTKFGKDDFRVKYIGLTAKCPYKVTDGKLIINHPKFQMILYDHDKEWSWMHINYIIPALCGIWPTKKEMPIEETFGMKE